MSIWDDLYIINEAKSAKQLVAEMSQEIAMKPKKEIKDVNKTSDKDIENPDEGLIPSTNEFDETNDEVVDDNGDGKVSDMEVTDKIDDEFDDASNMDEVDDEDVEDDFSDIETELGDEEISDEDLDGVDMDDELANSDSMIGDEGLDDGAIEETDEDKARHIHLLSCVNQLYDTTLAFSKKVSYLDDFPSENVNKLIRLLDFYREYKFDTAKPEDVEKVVRSSTKILKSLAERYRSLMKANQSKK